KIIDKNPDANDPDQKESNIDEHCNNSEESEHQLRDGRSRLPHIKPMGTKNPQKESKQVRHYHRLFLEFHLTLNHRQLLLAQLLFQRQIGHLRSSCKIMTNSGVFQFIIDKTLDEKQAIF